jgi:threonine/homoserine/homoserine lactone efflux protein
MHDAIKTGISFGLFLIIGVGPTIFAILKYSIQYGHRAGLSYIFGVSISDIMFVALTNLAASLLTVANTHMRLIGIGGAFLLIGMGVYGYFKKLKVARASSTIEPIGAKNLIKIASSGFFMNTLNPSVIITWLGMTAFVGGESQNYRITVFAITLGLVLGGDLLKVFMAAKVRKILTPRNIVYLSRISAICLFAVGVVLFLKFGFDIKIAGK